jgi:hypothetical protein
MRSTRCSIRKPEPAPAFAVRASLINGRGLFALQAIQGRRKLGELSGTLVQLPQARQAVADRAKIYLVELSRRWALECSRGNGFRFLNHSCAPNCYLRVYRRRVEVYSRRSIAAGAELTVDYHETPHTQGMRCRCGAAQCRGVL